jgi:hypothetical protein
MSLAKRMASGKKTSRSKSSSTKRDVLPTTSPRVRAVVCIKSGGYADLEPRKLYRVLRDVNASAGGLTRVVDDSGDDYLYPSSFFLAIRVPQLLFESA